MIGPSVLRRSTRRRGHAGQALTEFAFVLPIFILVMVGLFDLGRAVFSYNTITNAAREGARLAIVNQDVPSIIERSKQQTAIAELNDPSVEVAFYQLLENGTPDYSNECDLVAVGCVAIVEFEATYQPITPLLASILFAHGVTFTARSVLDVEYRCPNADFASAADCPKQP